MYALEAKWVSGRLDFVSISTQARVIRFGKSETTQVLRVCVYGMCESQGGRVSETEQAVFREMYRNKFYRVVRHKSWYLLFSSTKRLFIHSLL